MFCSHHFFIVKISIYLFIKSKRKCQNENEIKKITNKFNASSGDRRKKNSVYRPGGREVEIRSLKIFRRVGEEIRFGKKKFIIVRKKIYLIYVFSGVATAERIRRMHDLKIIHIQIINT